MEKSLENITPREEEMMQILWKLEKAFVNDIIDALPVPKPHRNTVSTVLRNLVSKGYVGYKAYGPTHCYFPLVSKASYRTEFIDNVINRFFDQSYKSLVAHFATREKVSKEELKEILRLIEDE